MITPLSLEDFIDKNYDKLRYDFVEELVNEAWYLRFVAENCDDWRDEFTEREYGMYVMDCESVNRKLQLHLAMKGYNKHHEHQVQVNWSDDPLYI